MIYNNGFPTNQTYQQVQTVPQIGYTQPGANQFGNIQNISNQQQPIFNQITDERIMVNGLDNVKLYPIAPNRMETLWDIDGKTFYRVTAGATPRIFYYEEVTSPVIQDTTQQIQTVDNSKTEEEVEKYDMSKYVKVDDIEDIIDKILDKKNKEIIEPQKDSETNQKVVKRTMSKTTNKGDK